jgi:cytoskeletal protein CcmA (bactofilin family)
MRIRHESSISKRIVYNKNGGTNKMGLFKDFKDDFSQAVNELVPGGEEPAATKESENLVVDTLSKEVDVESELSKLDGLLESRAQAQAQTQTQPQTQPQAPLHRLEDELPPIREEKKVAPVYVRRMEKEPRRMETPVMDNITVARAGQTNEEVSLITAGTTLTGDMQSSGSFDIQGTINGNITCNGKITVTGTVNGNTSSSEFFADVAKIEGEVIATGTVKVGTGSVIIGNITASSAVIAGAVKGDIDVQGPVVVDTSAVIMGNIKSRSVQINNGAVIEGFCSQCYADIDVQGLFEGR